MLDVRAQTFMTVVEAGSFSLASRKLYITPVSIKKQMDSLEDELGFALLERSNRGVNCTPAGRFFYDHLCHVQQLSESALHQMRVLAGQEKPMIRVGTSLLRPCSRLVDRWTRIGYFNEFGIEIVPFDDGPQLDNVIRKLGIDMDCVLGPCDAPHWHELCNVLKLGYYQCEIAVPKQHPLAQKSCLTWNDLENESLMLVKKGSSPVLDSIREEIFQEHPSITIVDTDDFYSIGTFNECERRAILMETLDVWRDVHPGFVSLPMTWEYRVPYGLLYAKEPTPLVKKFIDRIKG